ncbi:UNVERIFIED_CONTAM: hypothetical protein GTU68_060512 [Idotea baltica]|nr:hypothetical protein [Idotea baltica]
MTTSEILVNMNNEDKKVALAVEKQISAIAALVDNIVPKMAEGGRLFYIGAGTSGRLGILDASECPPTFGVPQEWVVGIIAGGDAAIRVGIENAEDDTSQAIKDLDKYHITPLDTVVGIAASGSTPYVIGGLRDCQSRGIATGCIVCNPGAPIIDHSNFPVVIQVGPEFVTGSTRMKSGTAQKLALNMISTSVMIKLGRVIDNKMVDMQLTNSKLVDRGTKMVMQQSDLSYEAANKALLKYGSVRAALDNQ